MKVYAIKRNDGKYKTETSEYLKEIWFAELFNDYETALCYCPSDCKIIECELMETTELADHEKQVRKRVCEEIRREFEKHTFYWYEDEENVNKELYLDSDWVWEVLDQIEKGE